MRRFMNIKSGQIVYVHEISYLKIARLAANPKFKELFSNE